MILSNLGILAAMKADRLKIENLAGLDPSRKPFNTSSVDLQAGAGDLHPQTP